MELRAGFNDNGSDASLEDVWYTFVLDVAREVGFEAYHADDELTVTLCKALERNAIGLWRSEESDPVIHERLSRMVAAAEDLLINNGFAFEWMDGYAIYFDNDWSR